VYLGSSRMGPAHSHYLQTQELGREASDFINWFLPAFPGIHACKFWYPNHVFTWIKNGDTWKHKITNCIL